MRNIKRRKFIQLLGGSLTYGLTPALGLPRLAFGNQKSSGVMVVLFQRGGCDGLNTLIPLNDHGQNNLNGESDWDIYSRLRPNLKFAKSYQKESSEADIEINSENYLQKADNSDEYRYFYKDKLGYLSPKSPNNLIRLSGTDFGIHPALHPLIEAWNKNKLTIFPATHVGIDINKNQFGNMSHFSAQQIIESGGFGNDLSMIKAMIAEKEIASGWIARVLNSNEQSGVNIFGFGSSHSLLGDPSILTLNDINTGVKLEQHLLEYLRHRNSERKLAHMLTCESNCTGKPAMDQYELARLVQNTAIDKVGMVTGLDNKFNNCNDSDDPNTPECESGYDNNPLGRQLNQAASLIKGIDNLQIVTVDHSGYDHHTNMKQGMTHLLGSLARNLVAFGNDLSHIQKHIEVVVITEFGRTADENTALNPTKRGTDHGQAFTAMVMAAGQSTHHAENKICLGSRNGYQGKWPGLNSLIKKQDNRYYLDALTDYRDILADVLLYRLGIDDLSVFQSLDKKFGTTEYPREPLGFIKQSS